MGDYHREAAADYRQAIADMMDDPGNEPGEQDDPDWVDTRKEVSPWDIDPAWTPAEMPDFDRDEEF